MNRTLLNLLLNIIQKSGQDLTPVRNLLGTPISFVVPGAGEQAPSQWKIYSLPNVINTVPLSPDDVMNQITALQALTAPVMNAVDGVLTFPAAAGTTLATTIINVPHPVSVRVEVNAPGRQIAIYAHETLVQRGSNNLIVFVNVSAGKTALNVVTQGTQNSNVTLNLPPDIHTDFTAFAPAPPTWLSSGTINVNYIDPSSGQVGVQLFWNNQTNVGGWDLYKVLNQSFGTIQQCSTVDGKYIIVTNFSGTSLLPYPGAVGKINENYIGILENASYSTDYNVSTFRFKSFDNGDSVFSGTLNTVNFNNIAVIPRNSNDTIISYADLTVQMGAAYSYTLDSFSVIDPTLRSDKIQTLTITTPNIPAIQSASLVEQVAGYLTLNLTGVDSQVRYWSGWIRKNNWPTVLSGSATAQVNNDYLKFYDEDSSQTTFSFSATNGFWYGIIVPYDANNNPGPRTICSGQVTGTGSGGSGSIPTITALGIDLYNDGAGSTRNRLWWTTNQAGERPGAGFGDIQIQITASNPDYLPDQQITTPSPRYIWQDWEDTSTNFNDTTNSRLLYGSMSDPFAAIPDNFGGRTPKYSTWTYTLNVVSGSVTFGTYHTRISGMYSSSANNGQNYPK